MRKLVSLLAAAAFVFAFGFGGAATGPATAAEPDLSAACDQADSVGGGQPGVSPGPTGNAATALGWDVGTGQCNGSFKTTADSSFPNNGSDGIELGMRAEQRREGQVPRNADLASGAGDYTVQLGADNTTPVAVNRAWWNFQHSIAYDGVIDNLDGLVFSIRTDVGANAPAAPQFDMLFLRPFIDDRQANTEPTATYDELYQTSQNPEFGYFTNLADDDANPDGDFDYDEEGAWMMTLVALKDDAFASVSICIHTPNAACDPSPAIAVYTCSPFEPPMDKTVMVKAKARRILPLKIVCTDENGIELTDQDIASPEVEVSKVGGGAVTTDGEEFLISGKGTDGNQFVYDGNRFWQFNLNTRNFSGEGAYEISVNPGGNDILAGGPTTTFVIN